MDLAITITIKPKHCKLPIEEQFDKLEEESMKLLHNLGYKFTLVAELTKAFNIHLHGVVRLPNGKHRRTIYDAFRDTKVCGFIYVKDIDNFDKWSRYVYKDIINTYHTLICRRPIIIDSIGLIPEDIYFDLDRIERSTPIVRSTIPLQTDT